MGRKQIVCKWLVSDVQKNNTLVNVPITITNTTDNASSIRMSQAKLYHITNSKTNKIVGNWYTEEKNYILNIGDSTIHIITEYAINRHMTFFFYNNFFNTNSSYITIDFMSSSSASLLLQNGVYILKPIFVSGFFANKKNILVKIIATDIDRTVIFSFD